MIGARAAAELDACAAAEIPPPVDAAGSIKAKVLICHGALDPFEKKEDLDAFKKAMDDAKLDYEFIIFSGAVHAFTNPQADVAPALLRRSTRQERGA